MIFVAAWPRYAVAETQAELDGAAIRAASGRALTLWPEQSAIGPSGGSGWSGQTITSFKADEPGSEAEPPQPQH
ncbi:hypothetical protein A5725_19545 [Mycobacterium kubicae]|nr:hypothetical protein A5725_19545 [Mycobacterium kubicae]